LTGIFTLRHQSKVVMIRMACDIRLWIWQNRSQFA